MKLKVVVIDVEIPKRVKQAALLLLLVLGLAAAVPYTFSTGDILSSKAVNANFADIDARLSSGRFVTMTDAGVSYSTGFTTYCGKTAGVTGAFASGPKTGYAAAKGQCESACSLSAHICSSEEVIRSASIGIISPQGWISTATTNSVVGGATDDCNGWLTGDNSSNGTTWTGNFAGWVACNMSEPILCCD